MTPGLTPVFTAYADVGDVLDLGVASGVCIDASYQSLAGPLLGLG